MRIAYLTQSYLPVVSGAAVVVQGLAEGMAQRGHQVLAWGDGVTFWNTSGGAIPPLVFLSI